MVGFGSLGRWGSGALALAKILGGALLGKTRFVLKPEDFGEVIGGVISLDAAAYFILADIDLGGARLEASAPVTLFGAGAEAVSLRSTGLGSGLAVLTTTHTLQLRTMGIISEAGSAGVRVDGSGGGNVALDWSLVNFIGEGLGAEIHSCSNFIGTTLGFLEGDGLRLAGSINTVGFTNTIFVANPGRVSVDFDPATVIGGRFRLNLCAVVAIATGVGVRAIPANFTLAESCRFENVNFAAGGNYLDGISYLDVETIFSNCNGIINSTRLGEMYWSSNATATVISAVGAFVKVAGTSIAGAINQRFVHGIQRLTYASPVVQNFLIIATASVTAGNNNQIALIFRKNGTEELGARITVTTNAAGRAENAVLQSTVSMGQNDYIEVFAANLTSTNNITITALDVIISVVP